LTSDAAAARKVILECEARLNSAGADRTKVKYEIYKELKSKGLDEAAELLMTFDVVTRANSGNAVSPQPPPPQLPSHKAKKPWITAAICTLLILLGVCLAPYLYTLLVNHFSPVVVPNSHFVGEHGRNKKLLIFVHGVIGDMDNTWVNPETHASWPELIRGDQSLRDFDVFVYGYASPSMGDASTVEEISVRFLQQLKDFGVFDNYKDVSFIAHSMGGIVTKRTLNMLNTQADSSILQKVHTVIYISVPSNGANLAALASWISDNPQFKSMSPKAASAYLQGVEGDWADLLRQRSSGLPFPRTYSAYETLPTGPVQVVPELYTSELSDGRVIGFDYNHINIVKPRDRDAEVYLWVKSRLLETVTGPPADHNLSTLQLTYDGTTDVLRRQDMRVSVRTPDNNENRGHCANEVGHHDGKYCTSRTPLTLATAAPRLLKNARANCNGSGCPWTAWPGPPTISADGFTATASIDNWGSDVDAILLADEYEKVSAGQCGPGVSERKTKNTAVLFTVTRDCLPIAALRWTLPDGSEGVMSVGSKSSPGGEVLLIGDPIDRGTEVLFNYKIVR
jgi:pimeloyl-ACP methyl ester carboxylesterase